MSLSTETTSHTEENPMYLMPHNDVAEEDGCPTCHCTDADSLIWTDDFEQVHCTICDTVYTPVHIGFDREDFDDEWA